MAELTRGNVTDRPWGRTLAALAQRALTGQLTLNSDGKLYRVAFTQGAVVGATSPLANDSAVRLALTGNLVTSTQVSEITRRIAAAPHRDEVEVLAEATKLAPDQVQRLRRRLVAQRAARTFSIEQGEFVVEDRITVAVVPGSELDVRAVIYMGARANLSGPRLDGEVVQLGTWFQVKREVIADLPQFGFTETERPVLTKLVGGASLGELLAVSGEVDGHTVRSIVYALVSCGACEIDTTIAEPRTRTRPSTAPPPPRMAAATVTPPMKKVPTQPPQPRAMTPTVPPQNRPTTQPPQARPTTQPPQARPTTQPPQPARTTTPTMSPRTTTPTVSPPPTTPTVAPRAATPTVPPQTRPPTQPQLGRTSTKPQVARAVSTGVPEQGEGIRVRTPSMPPMSRTPTPDSGRIPQPISTTGSGSMAALTAPTEPPSSRMKAASSSPTLMRARRPSAAQQETEKLIADLVPLLDSEADHFALLGVPFDAPTEVVRSSYFNLARKLHPDRLAALGVADPERNAQRLFAQINSAFGTLTDPVRRKEYLEMARRGGSAVVRAEQSQAEELAMRVMRAEEAFRQGEMAMRREQYAQAVAAFESAVELQPNEPEYQALLAWAKFTAATDKASVASTTRIALQRAADASETSITARFYLGRIERMLGREKEALSHFQMVLMLKPGHSEASSEVRVLEQRLRGRR